MNAADRETRLPFGMRSTRAYEAAMRYVTDRCCVLLAAWDEDPAARDRRTADTVRYAESIGRPVVHLDVIGHRVIVRGAG